MMYCLHVRVSLESLLFLSHNHCYSVLSIDLQFTIFEGRDPSCEIVNEANRVFVVKAGPLRPIIDFPQSEQAGREFQFQKKWYEKFNWLEYSASKDVSYCFICRCFLVPW